MGPVVDSASGRDALCGITPAAAMRLALWRPSATWQNKTKKKARPSNRERISALLFDCLLIRSANRRKRNRPGARGQAGGQLGKPER